MVTYNSIHQLLQALEKEYNFINKTAQKELEKLITTKLFKLGCGSIYLDIVFEYSRYYFTIRMHLRNGKISYEILKNQTES